VRLLPDPQRIELGLKGGAVGESWKPGGMLPPSSGGKKPVGSSVMIISSLRLQVSFPLQHRTGRELIEPAAAPAG